MAHGAAPFLHEGTSTGRIMQSVALCLLPAGAWGVFLFGRHALYVLAVSIGASLLTELVVAGLMFRRFSLSDGSAALTGLLLGYSMPPGVPLFIPAAASVFAIAVVKAAYGGLGRNWMNPALGGRLFALLCWPAQFAATAPAGSGILAELAQGRSLLGFGGLILGSRAGCIGEASVLLLGLGSIYLFAKRIIRWRIPASYLGLFAALSWIFGGLPFGRGLWQGDAALQLLTGGLVLGALYMATDPVTSPLSRAGTVVYGLGCALLTFLIKLWGSRSEGVWIAIVLMNMLAPLIDRLLRPRRPAGLEGGQ